MEDQKGLIKIDDQGKLPSAKKTSLLAMVDRFIASQDVSKPSRATYSRQLEAVYLLAYWKRARLRLLIRSRGRISLTTGNIFWRLENPPTPWTDT